MRRHGCDPCTAPAAPPVLAATIEHEWAYSGVPVLSDDGTLILAGRRVSGIGGPGDRFRWHALDARSLERLWGPVRLGAGSCEVRSCSGLRLPALSRDGERAYAHGDWNDGSSAYCAGMFAHDVSDGSMLWRAHSGGPHPRHPVALDEDAGLAHYGGMSGVFGSFDAVTGTQVQTLRIPGRWGGSTAITSDGDFVATITGSERTTRWNADGSVAWSTVHSADLQEGRLTLSLGPDDDVVVIWSGGVFQLDGASGSLRWQAPLSPIEPALIADDGAIFLTGRDPHEVVALERDGRFRWRVPLTAADGEAQVAFLDDRCAVVVRTATRVVALDTATGEQAWEFAPGTTLSTMHPTLLPGGDVLVAALDGRMFVLESDLEHADAPWPRARGNRFNSGRVWDSAPLP